MPEGLSKLSIEMRPIPPGVALPPDETGCTLEMDPNPSCCVSPAIHGMVVPKRVVGCTNPSAL